MKMTAKELNELDVLAQDELAGKRRDAVKRLLADKLADIHRHEVNVEQATKTLESLRLSYAKFLSGDWSDWDQSAVVHAIMNANQPAAFFNSGLYSPPPTHGWAAATTGICNAAVR